MRTLILFLALALSIPLFGNPLSKPVVSVVNQTMAKPLKIVNQSDFDADIFLDGFSIGKFKSTEDFNITMPFKEIKIVLSDPKSTTLLLKPADIPEKCALVGIRNDKLVYCPGDKP